MTLPQNVEDRIQKLSDRKLSVWQEMASTWLPGSTAPINADAFLSLIAEVRRCRAHLMSQEAEIELLRVGCEQNLLHAQMAESRLAAANAQLRLMHRVLSQAVCVACADDGSAKDHELDKLEGVLRDQGWITSAVVPSTPTDEHLQGAGDE